MTEIIDDGSPLILAQGTEKDIEEATIARRIMGKILTDNGVKPTAANMNAMHQLSILTLMKFGFSKDQIMFATSKIYDDFKACNAQGGN
jgi:hypothetical protein